MIDSKSFWKYLENKGVTFFSGVPCSILKEILEVGRNYPGITYIPAVKENAALGLASGACLAGKNSGILIQNSGVGNIINALTSFNLLYRIPVMMFITWRGFNGKDAPEHFIMGKKMLTLLKDLDIPYKVISVFYKKDIDWAVSVMKKRSVPVALILKEGQFI